VGEGIEFGRYQLIKKLAAGGMAQVWLARQPGIEGFEKLLVIKQVLPHLADDDSFISMFLDEARLAARLNHPNVVQVFDLGQEDESLYIAMEYIHGEDLRRLDRESRRRRTPIPIPLVCRIIADAAAGLHYAHTLKTPDGKPLGIVHRDVSPQNILATFEGGVKVVDFGIAKAADRANKTRSGVLKGKYAYMSPEQASGKVVDARTDVFALGILLHELLTGRRLFKREGEVATLQAVVSCEVEAPSRINPVVPPELDPIVLSALARDRDARLPDAGALQLALEDFLTQHRLPASSAHLRAYMREVFEERLRIEAEEGGPAGYLIQRATGSSRSVGLGALTPGMAREPVTTAERPGRDGEGTPARGATGLSASAAGSVEAEASNAEASSPGSVSRLAASLHRRRDVWMGIAGLILGVGVVGGALYLFGEKDGAGDVPTRVSALGPGDQKAGLAAVDAGAADASGAGEAGQDGAGAEAGAVDATPQPEADPPAPEAESPTPEADPPEADPPTPEADPPAPEAEAPPEPQAPRRPAGPAPGTLRASIAPSEARLEVLRGRQWRPVRGSVALPPGAHQLRVTLPDGAVNRERVEIASGQVQSFERRYAQGTLRVVIQPFGMGGEVRVRGRAAGAIPGPPIELYEGRHRIEVVGQDGRKVAEEVVVRAGAQTTVTVQLD
jgi:eukaryotic-like serine/threonine-protein kinase